MSTDEFKRRVELYFVGVLRGLLVNWTIVPSKGGDDETDTGEVEPPFVLVKVVDSEEVLADPPTHQTSVKVAYFARIAQTTAPNYSAKVGELERALRQMPKGYYFSSDVTINGLEMQKPEEIRDDEQDIHADVWSLAVGATAGPILT